MAPEPRAEEEAQMPPVPRDSREREAQVAPDAIRCHQMQLWRPLRSLRGIVRTGWARRASQVGLSASAGPEAAELQELRREGLQQVGVCPDRGVGVSCVVTCKYVLRRDSTLKSRRFEVELGQAGYCAGVREPQRREPDVGGPMGEFRALEQLSRTQAVCTEHMYIHMHIPTLHTKK